MEKERALHRICVGSCIVVPLPFGAGLRADECVGLDQKMLQTMNHDGSNGQPYANHLKGRTELYLVIPIREWDQRDVHE